MECPDFLTARFPLFSLRVRGKWKDEVIFQVVNGIQVVRTYSEYDGSTKPHMTRYWSKFAAAVWNWQQLSINQKAWFHSRASKLGLQLSGYNYFISLYMRDKLEDFMGYPDPHKLSHQKGGADELDLTDLSGTTPGAILGDGTVGIVFRKSHIMVSDGTVAGSIAFEMEARFNGVALAKQDNLAKGSDGTYVKLSADGHELILKNNIWPGVPVSVFGGMIIQNFRGVTLSIKGHCSSQGVHAEFFNGSTGANYDLTSLLTGKSIEAACLIITTE